MTKFRTALFFGLTLFFLFQSDTFADLDNYFCELRGGKIKGPEENCFCESTNSYFDPIFRKCEGVTKVKSTSHLFSNVCEDHGGHLENCGYSFSDSVKNIILADHSIHQEECENWARAYLKGCHSPDLHEFAKLLVQNITYLSSDAMFKLINQSLDDVLKSVDSSKDMIVFLINLHKSSEWITYEVIQNKPHRNENLVSREPGKIKVQEMSTLSNLKIDSTLNYHFILLDDAVYSGKQIASYFRMSISKILKHPGATLDVITAYTTKSGEEVIRNQENQLSSGDHPIQPGAIRLHLGKPIKTIWELIHEVYPSSSDMPERIVNALANAYSTGHDQMIQLLDSRGNLFFQHKVPDEFSTFPPLFMTGSVLCNPEEKDLRCHDRVLEFNCIPKITPPYKPAGFRERSHPATPRNETERLSDIQDFFAGRCN